MSNIGYTVILLFILVSCNVSQNSIEGIYVLGVSGMKNVTSGELEIVGEHDDYFGRITFHASKPRVYEIGLKHLSSDSLYFILPGGGGFLSMRKAESSWQGNFKYFGLKADIEAKKIGAPSRELQDLVNLKPLGKGIISSDGEESFPSYDQKNQVLYFTRDQKIYSSKFEKTGWVEPERLPFSQDHNDSAPYIIDNGSKLLFTSNRPIREGSSRKKNLWLVNKLHGGWNTPTPLPEPINIDSLGDYHGAAIDEDHFYFISYNRNGGFGRSDVYRAKKSETGTFEVTNLGNTINTDLSEADVFIDEDETYLLIASTGRSDSYGADDIYVSFKEESEWSTPINIGPKVNSYAYEYGAWVDRVNGYLYFNSYRRGTSDIYRVPLDELGIFKEKSL